MSLLDISNYRATKKTLPKLLKSKKKMIRQHNGTIESPSTVRKSDGLLSCNP